MRHNDPVKAGNIVWWDKERKWPYVVQYIKTADWKDDPSTKGVRYARISGQEDCACWMPVSALTVAKDTRSTNRTKQYEFLNDFKLEIQKQTLLAFLNNPSYGITDDYRKLRIDDWNKFYPQNPIPYP